MADNYTYETKCRRCGNITEWHFGGRQNRSWKDFAVAMDDKVINPRLMECEKCGKHTVQDVVSYTGPHG